jgi:hypothetical protein
MHKWDDSIGGRIWYHRGEVASPSRLMFHQRFVFTFQRVRREGQSEVIVTMDIVMNDDTDAYPSTPIYEDSIPERTSALSTCPLNSTQQPASSSDQL